MLAGTKPTPGESQRRWGRRERCKGGKRSPRRGEEQRIGPWQAGQGRNFGLGWRDARLEPCTGLGYPLQASPELHTSQPRRCSRKTSRKLKNQAPSRSGWMWRRKSGRKSGSEALSKPHCCPWELCGVAQWGSIFCSFQVLHEELLPAPTHHLLQVVFWLFRWSFGFSGCLFGFTRPRRLCCTPSMSFSVFFLWILLGFSSGARLHLLLSALPHVLGCPPSAQVS